MTEWGYMRVSTVHQDTDLQRLALVDAGVAVSNVFADTVSGTSDAASRQGMSSLLSRVQEGDTVTVWRIDRLGRSVVDVLTTVQDLAARGVQVRSLVDGIDPSTATGRLILGMMATLAEYERELIAERVRAGVMAAKARGVRFGRPPVDMAGEADKVSVVLDLVAAGRSVQDAGRIVGWSRSQTYRRLAAFRDRGLVGPAAG